MAEINLLMHYPCSKRNIKERLGRKTAEVRRIARKFGKEFFDGERIYGYGGYNYHLKFWRPVVATLKEHYHLTNRSSVLDIGCAKGFLLHDFRYIIPGITVAGIDISRYAIEHAMEDVRQYLRVGNARKLPYPDRSFDLVISINTIHNLPLKDCIEALREIMRVTRKHAFISVDAYRTQTEKRRMDAWNLTARTYMLVRDWVALFQRVGYSGDYYWFFP